jgi:putative protease
VVFDASDWRSPEEPEEGGRIYTVASERNGALELSFGRGSVDSARIRAGDLIWRTDDPSIAKLLRPYLEATAPVRKQTVAVEIRASEGKPIETDWTLVARPDIKVHINSREPLATAQSHSITEDQAREQLGRLGNTPYEMAELRLKVDGHPFVPVSLLNQLRRQAVEKLAALQTAPRRFPVSDPATCLARILERPEPREEAPHEPVSLHLLVRTREQLDAAIEVRPATVTLDFLDLYGLRPAVERIWSAGLEARVASPRILKPGEQRISEFLLELGCPVLIRPPGLLRQFGGRLGVKLIGDFSLNAANAISASMLLAMGLERITPTHDLNGSQIIELARGIGPQRLEVVAYHHMPVFHTEHCVFCRFLSTGTTHKDCGRPCESHRVELRDGGGRRHPVMADVGCRNTVFGAQAQEASRHLAAWLEAGIRHFRLEFAHESPQQVGRIADAFRSALAGETAFHRLEEVLRKVAPQGSTEGSFFIPADHLAAPVLD